MKTRSTNQVERDPCQPIQVDLSCMMDGELDLAAVRRVLVHVEVCPRCREFFAELRKHVKVHRDAWSLLERRFTGRQRRMGSRRVDGEQRLQLARIFYELGKAYILLSVSPVFRREVAVEPVPIPDFRLRGRAILDEVLGGNGKERPANRWVDARSLLNGHLDSELLNLDKGTHLLEESLDINTKLFEARIYLGHARNLGGDLEGACEEFREVLRSARALLTRGYALENLGNTYLQMGEHEDAARCFRRVVHGGVLEEEPRFFTSWFNLGLVYGLQGRFDDSLNCFRMLHNNFSAKHSAVREILSSHKAMGDLLKGNGDYQADMRNDFPAFFGAR